MLAHFKRLTGQILAYGLGDTINKIIAILVLPLFTHYLTPADFGVASILTVASALIAGLADLGLSNGLFRFFPEEEEPAKSRLVSTSQITIVLITVIIGLLGTVFASQLSQLFFKTDAYSYVVILNFLNIPLSAAVIMPLARLKLENKAALYSGFKVAKVVTELLAKVLLIVFLNRGLNGLFEAQIINAAFFLIVIFLFTLKTTSFIFSFSALKKMFIFGFPFALSPIFFWILNWADRVILGRLADINEVGLYTLGYTMGMAIMLPVGAFNTAWPVFYMSVAKDSRAKEFYSLTLTYFSLIIGFFILIVSIFSRDYFIFFTPSEFHGAYLVVPIIALSYVFMGHYTVMITGTYLKKKTTSVIITEIASVVINITTMFILIPYWGRLGAALATLISFICLPIIIHFFTYKVYPIAYEYRRLIQIFIAIVIVFGLANYIYQPTILNIFLRIGILLIYPVLLYLIGFFQPKELLQIKLILQKYFKSRKV